MTEFSPSRDGVAFGCVLKTWQSHEAELLGFLRHQVGDPHRAEDLLQEVFDRRGAAPPAERTSEHTRPRVANRFLSFADGLSVAYTLVHVLPTLAAVRTVLDSHSCVPSKSD
jgi:hypothetical protein